MIREANLGVKLATAKPCAGRGRGLSTDYTDDTDFKTRHGFEDQKTKETKAFQISISL